MITADKVISYATAIFSIAKDKPTIEKYYNQIAALDAMCTANVDFARILSARSIDKGERKEFVQTVLTGYGFEKEVIYWVWTILDNNFFHRYHYIALTCREIFHLLFGITRVKITSASELNEAQMAKIKDFFENKLKKRIDVEWIINPNLIGGLRIRVNNKAYINTYRTKLDDLKKQLLSKKG